MKNNDLLVERESLRARYEAHVLSMTRGRMSLGLLEICWVVGEGFPAAQTVRNRRSKGTWPQEYMHIQQDDITDRLYATVDEVVRFLVERELKKRTGSELSKKIKIGRPSLAELHEQGRLS